MLIGVLGDIHGNDTALDAVLSAARKAGVAKLLVAGDLVGYYFHPDRVIELLEPWDKIVVKGNHEQMLADAMRDPSYLPEFGRRFGSGLRATLEKLTAQQLDWLASLPHPIEARVGRHRILLCHGAPWDPDQYVYPDARDDLLARCAVPGYDLVILGHTHYPMHKQLGGVQLLNPGSVGQTRNRVPGAYWATLDADSGAITMRCEQYDRRSVAAEARNRDPDLPYLADVLLRKS